MNPKVYQIEFDGIIKTIKSFNDPVGVSRKLFHLKQRYIPWKKIDDKTTLVNGNIKFTEIDIPLKWVTYWC